jgi:hypothetical protein
MKSIETRIGRLEEAHTPNLRIELSQFLLEMFRSRHPSHEMPYRDEAGTTWLNLDRDEHKQQ